MSSDTIADIITSIRNADMYRKSVGFIEKREKTSRKQQRFFGFITLRHRRNRKRTYRNLLNLKRISRPGLRIYSNYQRIPRILGGMGVVILSTSRGIMTDREARLERIGGEILCYIW
ncbi:putative ribosomal protein S8 [Helianthus debilis subsp. tardiflorus]